MRKKGTITIKSCKPIDDRIAVKFSLENVSYIWRTTAYKSGKNMVPYANPGETFDVSFTVIGEDKISRDVMEVKNLRQIN